MKAYLYILDTLADWEIGYLTAELNSGRYLDKSKAPIKLVKTGNTLDPIKTMGGITITPDESIDEVTFEQHDLLILPGADTWLTTNNKKVLDIVSDIDSSVTIAAICGATMALAEHGVLNNIKHTSNDLSFLKISCPNYRGERHYQNQPVVVADNLITATGLAPLEFSYEVFKKINVMKTGTPEAWYQLFKTNEAKYYYALSE